MIDISKTLFTSDFNYQKVVKKDNDTISVPYDVINFTNIDIPHNLSRITSAKVWYDPGIGKRFPISLEQYVDDTSFTSEVNLVVAQAFLTVNSLTIQFRNASGGAVNVRYWYRIYYDS